MYITSSQNNKFQNRTHWPHQNSPLSSMKNNKPHQNPNSARFKMEIHKYESISPHQKRPYKLKLCQVDTAKCVYTFIQCSQNTTNNMSVSLCNIQQYVIYNYMFRPCKRAIIRLVLEPAIGLYNSSMGGTRSCLTLYFVGLHGLNICIDMCLSFFVLILNLSLCVN
jgi:hypothetical protein